MAARFLTSSPDAGKLLETGLPEVAFAGRSNVGKSTLVGRVLGRRGLVRTSRTPGRTQLLNMFVLDDAFAVVDLPGYGYAQLSHVQRRQMDIMVRTYLARRRSLTGVVLVLDARREQASQTDRAFARSILEHHRPLLIAITKADLIAKNRRFHHLRQVEVSMGLPKGSALMCSGKDGDGLDELRMRLGELAGGAG